MKKLTLIGVIIVTLLCAFFSTNLLLTAARATNTDQQADTQQPSNTAVSNTAVSNIEIPQLLRLQVATFDPLTSRGQNQPVQAAMHNDDDPVEPFLIEPETSYHIVQFTVTDTEVISNTGVNNTDVNNNGETVDALKLEQIAALGAQPLGYVPDNAYLVRISPPDAHKISALPFVRWIGPYEPGYKLSTTLAETLAAPNPPSEIDIYIAGFADESLTELETFIRDQNSTIRSAVEASFGPIVAATIPTTALDSILRNPAVSWVEPDIPLTLTNSVARTLMQTDEVWNDLGYYGAGQTIAVVDSGLSVQGALNADFNGRLRRAYTPAELAPNYGPCLRKNTWTDLNGHGTHVAGSAVGNGSNSGSNPRQHDYGSSHAGTAPEAELVFMAMGLDGSATLYCILLDGNFLTNAYNQGARIGSNSWGGTDRGSYGSLSRVVDEFIWTHPDYLALFAAGNAGSRSYTVNSPSTAKNGLSIGASENDRPTWGSRGDDPSSIASFSSRGPTADGRLKPDLVAPGTWILSTRAANAPTSSFWAVGNQNYAYHGGTSMATPLAAGGAALVREWFQRSVGIANPSAALLKATLIHGATSFNTPTSLNAVAPDFNSGWGRINLNNSISADYLLLEDAANGLNTGEFASFSVEVIGVDQIGTFVAAPPSGYVNSLATTGIPTHTGTLTSTHHATETISAFFTIEPAEPSSGSPTTPTISAASLATISPQTITDLTRPLSSTPASKPDALDLARLPTPSTSAAPSTSFAPRTTNAPIRAAGLLNNSLQDLIGGGDFEDPAWTDEWQTAWQNAGAPARTDSPGQVINGSHSMRIGGNADGNSIWYPIHFPAEISSTQAELSFNLRIAQQDNFSLEQPYDWFCVTMVDSAGTFTAPFSQQEPNCWHSNGDHTFTKAFPNLESLANFSGYLILYVSSNGQAPHMAATFDDVTLTMQFADATLTSTPKSGEAGTTFLLTGENFQPHSTVTLCYNQCTDPNDPEGGLSNTQITQVAVDSSGSIAVSIQSNATFAPATYSVQAQDGAGTTASTTFTIINSTAPTIVLNPTEGVAGSSFALIGESFLGNDNAVTIYLNGVEIGVAASNADGQIAASLKTKTSTQAGIYQVQVVDSAGNVAEANLTILAAERPDPILTVSPPSGPAGTQFVFSGNDFDAGVATTLYLDNVVVGTVTADAVGTFQFTLNSQTDATLGVHTLRAQQPNTEAATAFDITGPADPPADSPAPSPDQPSERVTELSFTLAWTDPPAQQFAASTLINNLDLTVDGPSGTVYGYGGQQSSSAGAQPDTVNNVERVRLIDPQPGTYVITVRAARVDTVYGAQPFALIGTQELVPLAGNASADPSVDTPQPTNTATPVPEDTPISDDDVGDETEEGSAEDIEQNGAEAPISTPAPTAESPGTSTIPGAKRSVFLPLVER